MKGWMPFWRGRGEKQNDDQTTTTRAIGAVDIKEAKQALLEAQQAQEAQAQVRRKQTSLLEQIEQSERQCAATIEKMKLDLEASRVSSSPEEVEKAEAELAQMISLHQQTLASCERTRQMLQQSEAVVGDIVKEKSKQVELIQTLGE